MIWALLGVVLAAGVLVAGSRLLRRRPAGPRRPAIDPFVLGEPWRRHVSAALGAKRRYDSLVATTQEGPLRDRLGTIGQRIQDAVDEAWQIARRGDELDDRVGSLGSAALRTKLEAATDPAVKASLESQLQAGDRIRSTRDDADARLRLLTTRMGELVAQAAEVSVGSDPTAGLDTAVEDVIGQLEALRQAVNELNQPGPAGGTQLPST